MQKKVVGVLGGMGPDATLDFMMKVIAATDASTDQDHIRMLIDHNPKVPNRNKAIHNAIRNIKNDVANEGVGSHLADMAMRLEKAGADFLVMVCNTAHAFKSDIQSAVEIPFVSIIDEVIATLQHAYPKGTKVGVMAAQGCLESKLYQKALVADDFKPVLWTDTELADFMQVMYKIKAGDTGETVRQDTLILANKLINKGAEVVLAGCTEIPLVLNNESISVPFLASTDILVKRVIEYSLGNSAI